MKKRLSILLLLPLFAFGQDADQEYADSLWIGRIVLICFDSDTVLYKLKVPQLTSKEISIHQKKRIDFCF